ncbi:ataxia telangiectasia mutated family protein [Tanacetum coccineum]
MYEGARIFMRNPTGNTEYFPVVVGLHQGSAISPYLFALILDELTRGIQKSITWCLIFADDIVLVLKTPEGLNERLEQWRKALEDKGLRVSREKTKYMRCDFNRNENDRNEKADSIIVDGARKRGRPKLRWEDRLKIDLKELVLSEDMTSDRNSWRTRIRVFLFPAFSFLADVLLLLFSVLFSFSPYMWLCGSFACPFLSLLTSLLLLSIFLEAVPVPSGRRVTVYIPPPSYPARARLGNVIVVVVLLI